jgi:uncharacterized protein (DUF1778 family)
MTARTAQTSRIARTAGRKRVSRSEKLDLRLTPLAKQTLQSAADATHKSMSEFVVESALARAEETLLDRRRFLVSAEAYDKFIAMLDAPPRDHPRLRRLLTEPSIFDKGGKE